MIKHIETFEKGNTMQILIYHWTAYNYFDVHQTFLSLGHEVDVIKGEMKSYDEDAEFEARLFHALSECSYDLVFTMNYFGAVSNVCARCRVKYVVWTCDSPLLSMYHKSVYNDCNYIFTFDKTNYLELKGMGLTHIWYLPLAADTDRLDHLLDHADDLNNYENDISFVGSLYERNTYDQLSYVLPDYLKGYFDAVIEAQLSLSGASIIEGMLTTDVLSQLEEHFHVEKSKDSFSDIGLIFSTTVLGFKIAAVQRHRALIALSKECPVSLYTGSPTDQLLRIRYRGGVDYWSQMPKVFRASKINLNFTIPNIKSGLPLRIWDVLGAGGFLMTNFQAELPLYFEEGTDLVCFDDEHDLVGKAVYYLAHEEERRQIAKNGYEKVKKYHSYRSRIEQMLRIAAGEEGGK